MHDYGDTTELKIEITSRILFHRALLYILYYDNVN